MNVMQEPLNIFKKGPASIPKSGGVGTFVMGAPRRPAQGNTYMVTPAPELGLLRAITSRGKALSSSNTRSASSHPTDESRIILALSEGRGQARGTVGIAAIDIDKPTLILCQIADVQNYTNTLTKINVLHPTIIIVPSTFVECVPENRLLTALNECFHSITVTSVPRIEFNSNRGLNQISVLCASAFESALLTLKHKFYASASAAALLRYIERTYHVVYCSHSIRVEHQEPEHLTAIDIGTADRLELVMSRSGNDTRNTSLLSVLDHCVTPVGKRLLRATILQPPCRQEIVEARLDCVSELLADKDLLSRLRTALSAIADVEQSLMLGSVLAQSAPTAGVSERQLNYTLALKSSLVAAGTLHDCLATVRHPVLRDVYSRLTDAPCDILLKLLATVLNDDAHPARGHSGDLQRCFAIRAGLNGLLDVARKTYTEIIDDMRAYVDRLAEKHTLPLRLVHNSRRGFHVAMRSNRLQAPTNLPPEFVQVDRARTGVTMTTTDLVSYGLQLRAASQEIMTLSGALMYGLLSDLRPHVARLYQLCDDIALLDTLQSLTCASAVHGLVRPVFSSYMKLKAARHPLLERNYPDGPIANPAVAHPRRNCHLITGPNMSGKSVYVRQLLLTQVMAQVGCYIPAEAVTLRLADRLYAIVGREDCIESGASSFVKEMREVRYLFDTLTGNSLIIMDELCRATSCDEGASIARAICEKLLATRAHIFIATHYLSLTTLTDQYPNVCNWHMETLERQIGSSNQVRLTFTHRLLPGVTPVRHYGIKLAAVCGGTRFVTQRASQLLTILSPTAYTDQLYKDRSQEINYIHYDLEANLELLELEKQLTPELRGKMIKEFEQKTGQTYKPLATATVSPVLNNSITTAELRRAVGHRDNSSTSNEELSAEPSKSNSTKTNDWYSYSEMNVPVSDSPSDDPLNNILKQGSNSGNGSSEWALPERTNTKSASPYSGAHISPSQEKLRSCNEQRTQLTGIVSNAYLSSDDENCAGPTQREPTSSITSPENSLPLTNGNEKRFTYEFMKDSYKTSTPFPMDDLVFPVKSNSKSNINLNDFPFHKASTPLTTDNSSSLNKNNSKSTDSDIDITFKANINSFKADNIGKETNHAGYFSLFKSSKPSPTHNIAALTKSTSKSKLNSSDIDFTVSANNSRSTAINSDRQTSNSLLLKSFAASPANTVSPFSKNSSKNSDTDMIQGPNKKSCNSNQEFPNNIDNVSLYKSPKTFFVNNSINNGSKSNDSKESSFFSANSSLPVNNSDTEILPSKFQNMSLRKSISPLPIASVESISKSNNSYTDIFSNKENDILLYTTSTPLPTKTPLSYTKINSNSNDTNVDASFISIKNNSIASKSIISVEDKTIINDSDSDNNSIHDTNSLNLITSPHSTDDTIKLNMIGSPMLSQQNTTDSNDKPKIKRRRIAKENEPEFPKRAKLIRRSSKNPANMEQVAIAKRDQDNNFTFKMITSDPIDEIIKKYSTSQNSKINDSNDSDKA